MSSRRIELSASAAQNVSGQGGAQAVANVKEITVFVDLTAIDTGTTLDVYLQSSSDGGTTWYDIAADWSLLTSATRTTGAMVTVPARSIAAFTTAAAKAVGVYTKFGDLVRAAWFINGTSYTFSVKAVVKT